MIGIKFIWNCDFCGNVLYTDMPVTENIIKTIKPKKCSCGGKKFTLFDFEKIIYEIRGV